MARIKTPANKKAEVSVEKIVPLTGKALQAKIKELSHLTKSETAKGCGYYSVAKDGKIRVSLTKFYDALLQSEGINVDKKNNSDGRKRKASCQATVQKGGQIMIGSVYTRALDLVPGDEFEIKVGYRNIHLKAIPKEA